MNEEGVEKMVFKENFSENLSLFQDSFQNDGTFKVKPIRNPNFPDIPIVALLSGAMVNNDVVDRDVIRALATQQYEPTPEGAVAGGIGNHTVEVTNDLMKAMIQIGSCDCIVLIGDADRCIIIDAKGIPTRGTKVPETEISLLGPEDGFTENIMASTMESMGKKIQSPTVS